jgi:hypothetical protein
VKTRKQSYFVVPVAAYIHFGVSHLFAPNKKLLKKNGNCEEARTIKEQHDADRAFNGSSQGIEADRH